MLTYPVRLIPDGDHNLLLTCPDVPEVCVPAASEEEAFGKAVEALESTLAAYVVDGRPIPAPTDICGAPTITTERFSLTGMNV